ncbi:MAG TPA: c-type cytochrome [Burkholderiales bacterium]|nr:c-type cytochrome [Burkholderiales bacterium]
MAFLIACGLALAPELASAQQAKAPAGQAAELRPVFATVPDIVEGKRVAEVSCARCHGANGISPAAGVPHIAGQRSPYLYTQMRAYLRGERPQSPMTGAVKFLSDDAVVKVSAYYGSLDPARPAAPPKPAPKAAAQKDPVQAGKAAAEACAGCHGDNGVSKTPGSPSLVGLDPKYLVAAINAYKTGQRKDETMKALVAGLSDADAANLALYFALQKPARAGTPAAGDAAAGKKAAGACAGCHGETGVAADPANPSLAGQDAQYLATAIQAYKDGNRKDETMKGVVASLNDAAIKNLAAFYAAQQPQAPKVRKPMSVAEMSERCDRCHGINGNSIDPMVPAIAAQRADWLEQVLNAYHTGARKNAAMAAMTSVMSETEVKELAAYYSRQTARAVTFIALPTK